MKRSVIKEQFDEGRLKLTTWETIAHYWFVIPILLMSFGFWFPEMTNIGNSHGIPICSILTLGVIAFFVYRQYVLLEFKKYGVRHSAANFKEAAKATAIELDWQIEKLDDLILIAKRYDDMVNWVGFRISIIRNESKIFENSIVEPEIGSHPFSFGRNARNLEYFNSNLIQSIKGENVILNAELEVKKAEEELENEPEWNFKNTAKRLIAYILILIFMTIFIFGLREASNLKFILIPIICIGYLIIDIKIMLQKRKKKNA